MHLRTLTLQALGPFVGRHTIDFEQLGASGLYLLEGPTGAGKSTLIDAIVFALYGKVAAADSSDDRLRSGFADEATETFVDLVFETGSGMYRVWRSPEWQRAKKRGSGTTKAQASVKLWRLGAPDDMAGEELISARLDEAGAEIQRAIGLDRSQFVQTIVLPQGEFASFLRADPEHRRGLLQKVFGTGVYEQVQEQLAVMRVDAQRAVGQARAAVGAAAAHFVGAAGIADGSVVRGAAADLAAAGAAAAAGPGSTQGCPSEGCPPQGSSGPGSGLVLAADLRALGDVADPYLLEAARAHVDALTGFAQRTARTASADVTALARARAIVDETRALAAVVARRQALRTEQVALLELAPAHAHDVGRRDLARRAAVLAFGLTAAQAADRTATRARELLGECRSQVPAELASLDRTALGTARDDLAAQVATLDRLTVLERGMPGRRSQLAAAQARLTASLADQAALTGGLATRPARRDELGRAIETARATAVDLPVRRQLEDGARARRDAAGVARDLEAAGITARRAAADALGSAQEAIVAEAHLRGRRLAGMAGELAAGLVAGAPCPVCGAVRHPQAAAIDADHATAQQVQEAEQARVAAEHSSAERLAIVATLTERAAGQRELAGPKSGPEHDRELADLGLLVRSAVAAQAELDELLARRADHDVATEQMRTRAHGLATATATGRAAVDAAGSGLAGAQQEIDGARGAALTVEAKVAELAAQVGACTILGEALEVADLADRDHGTRSAELTAGLADQGFANADAAAAAQLEPAELARLEAAVGAHEVGLARVAAGLAESAITALADEVVVDAESGCAELSRAEVAAGASGRAATLAAGAAAAAVAAVGAVESALDAVRAAQAAAEPVTRMAELAAASGGDNAKHLTLATYVLVKRFEDVVAAANERLTVMSDGRFELTRSDEREDVRSRRRGLSMKIVDHQMGTSRDPRTLSGGETFYVSLCLALGMADVVTAEAGGIELGTLFVDEGFGSLDSQTLEAVLVVLGKLRMGGRVVGVVSHVEALKQSIADRIEVRRLPGGASTLTVRAG